MKFFVSEQKNHFYNRKINSRNNLQSFYYSKEFKTQRERKSQVALKLKSEINEK